MNKPTGHPGAMNDLLALSFVPRWVIVPHSPEQTVAAHSHRATVIFMELASRLDLTIPYWALVWALVHDGPEAWSGDLPGPFKSPDQAAHDRHLAPWWAEIKDKVDSRWRELFKVADLIETGTFIRKFGIGRHASYAADHILQVELDKKVGEVAPMFEWGPEKLRGFVQEVIYDITKETGRCTFD